MGSPLKLDETRPPMARVTALRHLEGAQADLAVAAAQVQLVEVVVQHRAEALKAVPGVGDRHPLG